MSVSIPLTVELGDAADMMAGRMQPYLHACKAIAPGYIHFIVQFTRNTRRRAAALTQEIYKWVGAEQGKVN